MGQTLEKPLVDIVSAVAGKLGDSLCYLGPDFFLVDVSPVPEYFSPLRVLDYDDQAGRAAPGALRCVDPDGIITHTDTLLTHWPPLQMRLAALLFHEAGSGRGLAYATPSAMVRRAVASPYFST
jgi:hypothetical protein